MSKKFYLMRLLLALLFCVCLFSISLIFTTFRILTSHRVGRTFVPYYSTSRDKESGGDTRTKTNVMNYEFWAQYYNDNRLGRSWSFNIAPKYNETQLREYKPAVVVKKDAGRPGEMGSAVQIPPEKKELEKNLSAKYNFNILASRMMSAQRSFPDLRYPECKNVSYMSALPDASIIIIFHNEPWSLLVRTLWGIINKSPMELLREIILVDDVSDLEHLDKPLDDYLELLPAKITHIRTEKREGLIRARLIGAKNATGSVLIFLDAHVDCLEGWLEPILNRIANDRSVVAVPRVNDISLGDMGLIARGDMFLGWDWNLIFKGYPVPEEEMMRHPGDRSVPFRTTTLIGYAFAIDREFFFEVGAYDEGLEIWGSENMEMSLRVWLCGGSMEMIPCSHTTHIFRTSTYSYNGDVNKIRTRNNVRVAEVWLEENKEYFYMYFPEGRNMDVGDLTERKELKKRLKCRPFRWILDNVFTQSVTRSRFVNMGQIVHKSRSICLDSYSGGYNARLGSYQCLDKPSGAQGIVYFESKQFAFAETYCVGLGQKNQTLATVGVTSKQMPTNEIIIVECDAKNETQKWELIEKGEYMSIQHIKTGLCMDLLDPLVVLRDCGSSDSQRWKWKSSLPANQKNTTKFDSDSD